MKSIRAGTFYWLKQYSLQFIFFILLIGMMIFVIMSSKSEISDIKSRLTKLETKQFQNRIQHRNEGYGNIDIFFCFRFQNMKLINITLIL